MGALTPLIARTASILRLPRAGRTRSTRFSLSVLTGFLLASGAAMFLLYALSSRVLEEETLSLHRALLEQASRSMDAALLQVDAFVQQLAIDPYLGNFPAFYRRGDYATLLRINEDLNNLRIINTRVHSMEVYFRSTRQVFIPNTGVLDLDSVGDAPFLRAVDRGTIREGWQAARTIRDVQSDKDLQVVSVVKFLRQGSAEPDAFMVVNIGEDFLRSLVGVLPGAQHTELLITDSHDGIVARLSTLGYFEALRDLPRFAESLTEGNVSLTLQARTRYLVTVVRGTLQDWRYVSILPFPAITARIRFLQTWSLVVILLGLLASLAVAVFFSRRLNALLRQILLRTVPEGGLAGAAGPAGRSDPLSAIESSLASLHAQAREAERSLQQHLPVLQNNALEGLFKGRLDAGEAQRGILQAYGLSLGARRTYVAMVASFSMERLSDADATAGKDLVAVQMIDRIRREVPQEYEFAAAFTRDDEIALLIDMDVPPGADEAWADRLAGSVYRSIGELFGAPRDTPIVLGMSAAHEGLGSVPLAYREARKAARSAVSADDSPIVRYDELSPAERGAMAYPFDEEADLMEALKKGDARGVERGHAALEQALSGAPASWHYVHLLGSLLKATHDLGMAPAEIFGDTNPYLQLPAVVERGGASRFFHHLYARVIETVRARKASRNRQAADRIAAYVRAHYAEDLSLFALSRRVFMSAPYLSRIFHEEMKAPLRHFIASVRIAKAQELLRDPGLKVSEVGRRVGYGKPRGFLKFFKEQVGMTPLEYRATLGAAMPGAATLPPAAREGPPARAGLPGRERRGPGAS